MSKYRRVLALPLVALIFAWPSLPLCANVRLPSVLSDHMVLQAGAAVPIWGWASPGEHVNISIAEQTKSIDAAPDGTWRIMLEPLNASDHPQTLTVKATNTITIRDVLIGEAWLASGQSNMEFVLSRVDRAAEEIAAAKFPQIRMFVIEHPYSIYELPVPPSEPAADVEGHWYVCSPETAARFSAVGYFFARELHAQLKTPVGILAAAVGGTPIEAWTGRAAQEANPDLRPMLDDWQTKLTGYDPEAELKKFTAAKQAWLKARAAARANGDDDPKAPSPFKNQALMRPACLFNGVIAPLIPYKIRGVIWYQGERNAAGPFTSLYGRQLATLIPDWRKHFGDDFYFAWVQLPRFQKEQKLPSEPNGWGVFVRDEMRKTLAVVPKSGMAITIDLGGPLEGHPLKKAPYAHRLALLALHDVYGKPIEQWSGPLLKSAERRGREIVLTFDHARGLKPAEGDLKGFAIAGADQKFVWANAKIADDHVIVSADKIPEPAAVRYGWSANPTCNLVNAADLPASPFRTDDWK